MDPLENQSLTQKKIAFAQSEYVATVLAILKESSAQTKLVGDTEYETIVNAVTLDAQSELIMNFINTIDRIKRGDLVNSQSNGN